MLMSKYLHLHKCYTNDWYWKRSEEINVWNGKLLPLSSNRDVWIVSDIWADIYVSMLNVSNGYQHQVLVWHLYEQKQMAANKGKSKSLIAG